MKTPISPSAAGSPAASGALLDQVRKTGLAAELIDEIERRVKRRRARRRTRLRVTLAAAACVAGALWAIPYARSTATLETASARRETFELADGSQAQLNARTHVRTDFRYGRRVVRLDQGEAFFSVTKDPAHPFLVVTPAGTVRVTGTQFNVRLADATHVVVTLVEGHVAVNPATPQPARATVSLTPGQQFESDAAAVRELTADDLANTTAWRQGRLVLDGLTLREATDRLAGYHGVRIEVATAVAGLRLGGSCALDDLPQFLEILRATKAVQVVSAGDGAYRVVAR